MPVAAIDFETFYSKAEKYTIQERGVWHYVHDPRFDPYLVSVVSEDLDIRWVGEPKDFDWTRLDVSGLTLIAHNASFDQRVFERMVELGGWPGMDKVDAEWACTADLSRYCQGPRNLAKSVKVFFGVKLSKQVRSSMDGKTLADAMAEGWGQDLIDYGLDDSVWCLELWKKLSPEWPQRERDLSQLTRDMAYHGAPVDLEKIDAGIAKLSKIVWEAEQALPWRHWPDPAKKGRENYKPLSPKGLAVACAKEGIPVPKSRDKKDPEYHAWLETYRNRAPFVDAMARLQTANGHLQRLQTMRRFAREDGSFMMPYGLKYAGADTTLRWSGDGGLNTQNMLRDKAYDVGIRECVKAPEGYVFGIVDLGQIEPRCLHYVIGDTPWLEMVRTGVDVYEAHARQTMGYEDPRPLKQVDKPLRSLAKVRELQLGYGSGWKTLLDSAPIYGIDPDTIFAEEQPTDRFTDFEKYLKWCAKKLRVSKHRDNLTWWEAPETPDHDRLLAVNAWLQVQDYRKKNPKVVGMWNDLEEQYKASAGGDYAIKLFGGGKMRYFGVRKGANGATCFTQRGGERKNFYGAKFVENICQRMGRDVFGDRLLYIRHHTPAGLPCLQIHDEGVWLLPESEAQDIVDEVIIPAFRIAPEWAPGLPLDAEGMVSDVYCK